jgi:hypothetical protein
MTTTALIYSGPDTAPCDEYIETLYCACGEGADGTGACTLAPCNVSFDQEGAITELVTTTYDNTAKVLWTREYQLCFNCGRVYRDYTNMTNEELNTRVATVADALEWTEVQRDQIFRDGGDVWVFNYGASYARAISPYKWYVIPVVGQVTTWRTGEFVAREYAPVEKPLELMPADEYGYRLWDEGEWALHPFKYVADDND